MYLVLAGIAAVLGVSLPYYWPGDFLERTGWTWGISMTGLVVAGLCVAVELRRRRA
jgi:hypothetical protein